MGKLLPQILQEFDLQGIADGLGDVAHRARERLGTIRPDLLQDLDERRLI